MDENNDQNSKKEEKEEKEPAFGIKQQKLTEERLELMAQKREDHLKVVRLVKNLNPDKEAKWTLTQELLQEVMATYIVENPDIRQTATRLKQGLIQKIEEEYSDEPETRDLLLASIPNNSMFVKQWTKREGWEDAVWEKLRGRGLFSKERRTAMVNAIYKRGLDKSDIAAKLWLQLSGDLVEGSLTQKEKATDAYREINEILRKKNS
jgi:hypothetical protein